MSDQALEQSQPTAELSVEDRMAALYAEPEEEQEEAAAPQDNAEEADEAEEVDTQEDEESEEQVETEEEEAEPDLVEIEVDGETYRVPEALKDKIMLQADYTRKTQEVAEQRKQVEVAQAQLQQAAQFQQQSLAEYAQLMALDTSLQQYEQVNWNDLYDSDPAEFVRLKEARRDLIDQRGGLANQINAKQEQQFQQQTQTRMKLIEDGKSILAKEIPNWSNDYAKTLNTYAVEKFGFTPEEVNAIVDPRAVKLIHTAYQRDKQVTNRPITDKRVVNLPKVSKPGGVSKQTLANTQEQDARKALKKTGSVDAATAVFLARLSK